MIAHNNPFVYAGANDLSAEEVDALYIEDFNYSRFLQSKRNIVLVGERGCGKSMTLIYNSLPVQKLRGQKDEKLKHLGIYIPCNTPLIHREEYELLSDFQARVLSEHFLVLAIAYSLAETLSTIPDVMEGADETALRNRFEFIFDAELPTGNGFFQAIMTFAQRQNVRTQQAVNDRFTTDIQYGRTFSFNSVVVPILGATRAIPKLHNAHFLLLFDDAHDLNNYQRRALASWIAYRDHSLFSIKLALANISTKSLRTSSGGSILEGHDYILLDMVQPYQSQTSDFGQHAERVIQRRINKVLQLDTTPNEFFPMSEKLTEDLASSAVAVRREAEGIYGDDRERIADYVYKFKRANYFRQRSTKANRPEYSGFSTLVFLSTGVIRNLLDPCYWMYDKLLSHASEMGADVAITRIPPNVQSEIILRRSNRRWDWLRDGIDQNIVGCSQQDAKHCYQLLDQLATHFRERLFKHTSEPRANSFTISSQKDEYMTDLNRLIEILREGQLLYVRSGVAKEKGRREWYYVPNRLLWPERGLDPHGQHARVSLPASVLWEAAFNNRPIPFEPKDTVDQEGLFDAKSQSAHHNG